MAERGVHARPGAVSEPPESQLARCGHRGGSGVGPLALRRLPYSARACVPQAARSSGQPRPLTLSVRAGRPIATPGVVFDAGTSRALSRAARARSNVREGGGTSATTSARTRTSRETSPPSWSASSRGATSGRRCQRPIVHRSPLTAHSSQLTTLHYPRPRCSRATHG